MTAVILANGEFPRREYPLWLLKNADVVVCCDSARNLGRLQKLGVEPVAVVGDMDSISGAARKALGDRAVKVEEQDYNDLNKAFLWLRKNYPQADDIRILGALGRSEAHALSPARHRCASPRATPGWRLPSCHSCRPRAGWCRSHICW